METKKAYMESEQYPAIIIGKLLHISGILQREGNRLLLPFGLNQQQFSIFFEIARAGAVKQKDMVNRLSLEKAHVSKAVKKLQAMGLITVKKSENDSRSVLMSVTEQGKTVLEQCREVFKEWNARWFETIPEEQLQAILISISQLQDAFTHEYNAGT